jgi:hypothetical protein
MGWGAGPDGCADTEQIGAREKRTKKKKKEKKRE